jgi:hypothetical protein
VVEEVTVEEVMVEEGSRTGLRLSDELVYRNKIHLSCQTRTLVNCD